MLLGMPHKYTGGIGDENMVVALYCANSGSIFRNHWFNFTQVRLIRYAIINLFHKTSHYEKRSTAFFAVDLFSISITRFSNHLENLNVEYQQNDDILLLKTPKNL